MTDEPNRPDTINLEPVPPTASLEAGRLEATRLEPTRLEKCLGAVLCVIALVAGVGAGFLFRAASARAESLEERRVEVAELSPAEKDHLRHQFTRFTALPKEQQERLRQFDQELSVADDAEDLRRTLRRFNDWLRTISLADRNELLKLAGQGEHRVDRVEELSPLSRPDSDAVDNWLAELAPWKQWLLGAFGDRGGRRPVGFGKAPPAPGPGLTDGDFDDLSPHLTKLRQAELGRQKSSTDKRRVVATWLQRRRSPTAPIFGPVSADELVRFFTDDLDDGSRRRLLAMPPDQWNRELREEYRKANSREGTKRPPSAKTEKE